MVIRYTRCSSCSDLFFHALNRIIYFKGKIMETSTNNLSSNPAQTGKTVAGNIGDASAGAHQTIDKVTDAARPAVDRVATGAHQVVDKLAGVAANAAETLGVKGEQLKEAQTRATESFRDYVRENPLASVGIAVAAGILLSKIINTRS
ncbi:MAG: DUF883 family protein [Sulfuriferula sp.]